MIAHCLPETPERKKHVEWGRGRESTERARDTKRITTKGEAWRGRKGDVYRSSLRHMGSHCHLQQVSFRQMKMGRGSLAAFRRPGVQLTRLEKAAERDLPLPRSPVVEDVVKGERERWIRAPSFSREGEEGGLGGRERQRLRPGKPARLGHLFFFFSHSLGTVRQREALQRNIINHGFPHRGPSRALAPVPLALGPTYLITPQRNRSTQMTSGDAMLPRIIHVVCSLAVPLSSPTRSLPPEPMR